MTNELIALAAAYASGTAWKIAQAGASSSG